MTTNTQTVSLASVFTRYAYNKIGGREYKDNKYKKRPLLMALRERRLRGDGGPNIVHPVNLGTSKNGKSLARNETFTIKGDANETWARYLWKTVIETCFVSWWDIRESRGNKFKMKSHLDSRIDETRENLNDNVLEMICQSSAADTDDITPLLTLIKTSGEVGGLDPANARQTTWKSENLDTIDWSVSGVSKCRTLKRKLIENKGNPDLILVPGTFFDETCETADAKVAMNQDLKTRGGTKYADLGAQVPIICGLPLISDPKWDEVQTSTGLMLDLDGVHLVVDPMWDNYMYPFKEMAHHGRLGQASVKLLVCELTASSRRTNGYMTTIS